ncbi:transposase [Methyloversatilis sp. XJ19-49]|uniref:REP-associated tyrosine transposase n=1 Tax=Methyloversatilis sp. XJ19-49 TaxID=2963429 RepID=UPI00211CA214|nr:transposase [Methyloversatilis sp. XJ19-49]MCQ9378219.1 transposase [Methyloversatilis sp. XJ19-49]
MPNIPSLMHAQCIHHCRMRYRRSSAPGATFFFTLVLADRSSGLLQSHIGSLREAVRVTALHHPFHIDAAVVLPDHLHMVWTLPAGDADYATRWMLVKAAFSRALPRDETMNASRLSKGERGVWQRRYWEHLVRDDGDFARHVDYIHFNPVQHGLVERVADWPHSSFHRYVERGVLPADWGGRGAAIEGRFGE